MCIAFGLARAESFALVDSSAAFNSSSSTNGTAAAGACRARTDVVALAMQHTNGQQYCECVCPSNAPWRCDCSGLVSRAWGLASPGLTTYDMQGKVCSKLGSRGEMLPGDALLWPGVISQGTGHVAMFIKWVDQKAGSFLEAACHSKKLGCTHEVQTLSYYGPEYFPCRPHSNIVC
jgi:cell wall-associated NlpC family hydrolase